MGNYTVGVSLEGGNPPDPAVIVVFAPETHGVQPPDAGEDTTAPVVTITPEGTPGSTATFTLAAVDANTVTFECQLTRDLSVLEDWAACTSPVRYANLLPGSYVFSARGTDKALNVSAVVIVTWTVDPPLDTTPPVVTITPVGILASTAKFELTADEDPVTFECGLTRNGTAGDWATCTSPMEYTGLKPGSYVFSARATDSSGNTSVPVSSATWTVKKGGGAQVD